MSACGAQSSFAHPGAHSFYATGNCPSASELGSRIALGLQHEDNGIGDCTYYIDKPKPTLVLIVTRYAPSSDLQA